MLWMFVVVHFLLPAFLHAFPTTQTRTSTRRQECVTALSAAGLTTLLLFHSRQARSIAGNTMPPICVRFTFRISNKVIALAARSSSIVEMCKEAVLDEKRNALAAGRTPDIDYIISSNGWKDRRTIYVTLKCQLYRDTMVGICRVVRPSWIQSKLDRAGEKASQKALSAFRQSGWRKLFSLDVTVTVTFD